MQVATSERHISVWLTDDNDDVLKKFHCIHCGKVVFEFYSSANIIVPGDHQQNNPKVIMCRGVDKDTGVRCKAKYFVS
jgi:hypothetical protein